MESLRVILFAFSLLIAAAAMLRMVDGPTKPSPSDEYNLAKWNNQHIMWIIGSLGIGILFLLVDFYIPLLLMTFIAGCYTVIAARTRRDIEIILIHVLATFALTFLTLGTFWHLVAMTVIGFVLLVTAVILRIRNRRR